MSRGTQVICYPHQSTVDWKYNMEFIKEKFPRAEIFMIEAGGHQRINETLPMRTEVIQIIADYLAGEGRT